MVVAVQKGLENIKEKLREKGYDVVTFGEYNYPIDAVVYNGAGFEGSFVTNNNMPSLSASTADRSYGVFLVNATNRTIEEIDHMLQRKVYSPLF
ncbi:YkuS family protein [Petroclostridium sp. X23]|uniref:YkuS family protein n=1 Tax=Petroclostridium sp. X23 TaxID=3045146 RepID=UPI0024AD00A0|nr:YkuS family protein [Petroclostridium sp. X23]WHH59618.1 YkuS family protein [Petroclostridium sp. X23]